MSSRALRSSLLSARYLSQNWIVEPHSSADEPNAVEKFIRCAGMRMFSLSFPMYLHIFFCVLSMFSCVCCGNLCKELSDGEGLLASASAVGRTLTLFLSTSLCGVATCAQPLGNGGFTCMNFSGFLRRLVHDVNPLLFLIHDRVSIFFFCFLLIVWFLLRWKCIKCMIYGKCCRVEFSQFWWCLCGKTTKGNLVLFSMGKLKLYDVAWNMYAGFF